MKNAVGLCAGLMLLICLDPVGALLSKNLVDLFAHGYSASKALLLPLFMLLALGLDRSRCPTPSKLAIWAYMVSAAVAHLLAVVEQVWLNRIFQLAPLEPLMALKNGYWSISGLTHIHVSKTLLAPLVQNVESFTDAGHPFEQLLPTSVAQIHLAVFLCCLALALLSGFWAFRERSAGEATSLCLVLFAITKTAIDGGPLCSEFLSAVCVLGYLTVGRRSLFLSGSLIAIQLVGLEQTPLTMLAWGYPSNLLILSFPFLWERTAGRSSARRLLATLAVAAYFSPLLLGWLLPAFAKQPYGLNLLRQGLQQLKAGSEVSLVTTAHEPPVQEVLEVQESVQAGPYTLLRGRLVADTSVLNLWRTFKLPPSRQNLVWGGQRIALEADVRGISGPIEVHPKSPLIHSTSPPSSPPLEGYQRVRIELRADAPPDIAYALLGPELMVVRRARFYDLTGGNDRAF